MKLTNVMIMRIKFSSTIITVIVFTWAVLLSLSQEVFSETDECKKFCGSACSELKEEEDLCLTAQKKCDCTSPPPSVMKPDDRRDENPKESNEKFNQRAMANSRDDKMKKKLEKDRKEAAETAGLIFGLHFAVFILITLLPFIISCIIALVVCAIASNRPPPVMYPVGTITYTTIQAQPVPVVQRHNNTIYVE